MKQRGVKWIVFGAILLMLVLSACYCVLRFVCAVDVFDRSGWHPYGDGLRYLDYYGRPLTGWQEIESERYYFDQTDGTALIGWHHIDQERYYFGNNGVLMTGLVKIDGVQYLLDEDGAMLTGWQSIGDKRFYFGNDGASATGLTEIAGVQFYFDENGAMVTGWLPLDNKYMYFSDEGILQTGWLEQDGKRYYLSADGVTVSGWVEIAGIRYYFNDDGSVVTGWFSDETGHRYFFQDDGRPGNGWLDWEQKRYYLGDDGSVTVGWLTVEDDRYYFLPSGRMAIGEVEVDGISRFFTSTGKEVLLCNPWHSIPEDFELDLVSYDGFEIDRSAQAALEQMISDIRADGIYCTINNTYRSNALQQMKWDTRVSERMALGMTKEEAEALTGQSLAIPGHSEHETGLALDVDYGEDVYQWLGENCWDYGFILRYPEGCTDVTGIIYEPWHFRYVGTELSAELKELGLCMEEYMAMLTEQQNHIAD